MEKINLVEILKDYPKGIELDCTVYNNATLEYVYELNSLPICVRIQNRGTIFLSKYGQLNDEPYCKCIIFPKGKTTWEGFVPPCQFKDGDIIFTHTNASKGLLEDSWVSIFKEYRNNRCACYACLCLSDLELYYDKLEDELLCELCEIEESRLATEEEKQKLFDAIKANGYKWNAETKTLEKLVEPKFKVGDRIVHKKGGNPFTITEITNGCYKGGTRYALLITQQDNFELVPNKFDINTLVPFESKVLVRDDDFDKWKGAFWSHLRRGADIKYETIRGVYRQCIPYNDDTKHLLGKTNDCSEFYKNWK